MLSPRNISFPTYCSIFFWNCIFSFQVHVMEAHIAVKWSVLEADDKKVTWDHDPGEHCEEGGGDRVGEKD